MKWLTLLGLVISLTSFSQTDEDILRGDKGVLYMKNGETTSTFIEYSTYTNVLRETPNDKILSANDIEKFEYFDRHQQRNRTFISRNGAFFEVLAVCDSFMLLDRTSPIDIKQSTGPIRYNRPLSRYSLSKYKDPGFHTRTALIYTSQIDLLCFLVKDEIQPYIIYKLDDVDDLAGTTLEGNRSKTTATVINKDLPKKLLGSKFKELQKYAHANNLRWKDKNELALILAHYNSLK